MLQAEVSRGCESVLESTARVLIVDDEAPQMRAALCDTLKDHGYETVGFSLPKDALATLQAAKFDLLLADLMMPEMNGIDLLEAAQRIVAFEVFRSCPFLK